MREMDWTGGLQYKNQLPGRGPPGQRQGPPPHRGPPRRAPPGLVIAQSHPPQPLAGAGPVRAARAQVTLHAIGDAVVRFDADQRVVIVHPVASCWSFSAPTALDQPVGDVLRLHGKGTATI